MSPHFINRLRMAYVFVILMVRVGLVKRSPTYEAYPSSYEAQPNQQAIYSGTEDLKLVGEVPVQRLNARVKLLESVKPSRNVISVIKQSAIRSAIAPCPPRR